MTPDPYIWPARDLAIALFVCLFATVGVLRKKSPRERLVLFVAAMVLILLNGTVFIVFGEGTAWWKRLPLYDLYLWLATLVVVIFNRIAATDSSSGKDKETRKP